MSRARQIVDNLLEVKLPAKYRKIALDTVRGMTPIGRECEIVSGVYKGYRGRVIGRDPDAVSDEWYLVQRFPRGKSDAFVSRRPVVVHIDALSVAGAGLTEKKKRLRDQPVKIYADHSLGRTYFRRKCPQCFKPGAVVGGPYTPISSVQSGSWCLGDGGIQRIAGIFSRKFSGSLVRIKANGLFPLECTPEHPILVYRSKDRATHANINPCPEWVKASDLRSKRAGNGLGDYLVVPMLKGTRRDKRIDMRSFTTPHGLPIAAAKGVPLSYPLLDKTAWLLGVYIAEGYASANGIRFSLGKHEGRFAKKIARVARMLGYACSAREVPTALCVEIPSRILARLFSAICGQGAWRKRIPDVVLLHRNRHLLGSLLDGYIQGDGYPRPNRITASTASKTLAHQLQLAYARFGLFAYLSQKKG
jgi:hypothetical protein